MLDKTKFLISLLGKSIKLKFVKLQIMIFITSIINIVSILSIGPLIASLTNFQIVQNYIDKKDYLKNLNLNETEIIGVIIIFIILIFILSNAANIITTNYTYTIARKINNKLFQISLNNLFSLDYYKFIRNNTSEYINSMTIELGRLNAQIIGPLLNLNSRIIPLIVIIISLTMVNFYLSIGSILIFTLIYFVLFSFLKTVLKNNSKIITKNTEIRHKLLTESFINFKELKIFNAENYFLNELSNVHYKINKSINRNVLISILPKNISEILAIIIFTLIVLILKINNFKFLEFLPLISIYLIAIYKMLPLVQTIANAYSKVRGNYTALDKINNYLIINENKSVDINLNFKIKNLHSLKIKKVFHSYDAENSILEDIDIDFKSNTITGVIGGSGTGKTTLLNICSGLIKPSRGKIILNEDIEVEENSINLYNFVSYVPQSFYLIDESIKKNIAFGVNETEISDEKIDNAIKISGADKFINTLSNGINSKVGEFGNKFSGGQIQRLAVARAFYKDSPIIILDEVTSNLDKNLSKTIINNIKKYSDKKIVIIVTHDNNLRDSFDKIFELKNKKLNQI